MSRKMLICYSLTVFFIACIYEHGISRKDAGMLAMENMQSMRPTFKDGDTWFIICAEEEQLPRRKEPPREYPDAEQLENLAREKEAVLSKGNLPEVRLQKLDGYTVWRKFRYEVKGLGQGSDGIFEITVTESGYYEIPATVLAKYGFKPRSVPALKIRYIFDRARILSKIEWIERQQVLPVNGQPVVLDWDFIKFPAGFPSFQTPIFDAMSKQAANASSQFVRFDKGAAIVWLSKNLSDIQPVSSHPAVEYEVQKWRQYDKWWHEAFVVRGGEVFIVAKMLN